MSGCKNVFSVFLKDVSFQCRIESLLFLKTLENDEEPLDDTIINRVTVFSKLITSTT